MPFAALRNRAFSFAKPGVSLVAALPRILYSFGEKLRRCYLPEESVLVREPSAFHFRPAVSREFLPVISISSCVSQLNTNEMASVNLDCGPPFKATNSCPFSSNVTVITWPFFSGNSSSAECVICLTFEFLNTETQKLAASSALLSNHNIGVILCMPHSAHDETPCKGARSGPDLRYTGTGPALHRC